MSNRSKRGSSKKHDESSKGPTGSGAGDPHLAMAKSSGKDSGSRQRQYPQIMVSGGHSQSAIPLDQRSKLGASAKRRDSGQIVLNQSIKEETKSSKKSGSRAIPPGPANRSVRSGDKTPRMKPPSVSGSQLGRSIEHVMSEVNRSGKK